jgi:hypothetical protein
LLVVVTLGHRADGRPAQAVDSPLDLRALDGVVLVAYRAAFAVTLIGFVLAAASLVGRFRRARGTERQQLRWVALATVVVALLGMVHLAALALGAYALAPLAGGLSPPILSAAIGAAILRYRLYDLDRIVSRALAYGLLTLLLGGGYAGWSLGSGSSWAGTPTWWWPGRPWRWRRCFSRLAAASKPWLTAGSIGVATTPPGRSRCSAPGCARRSTWTP